MSKQEQKLVSAESVYNAIKKEIDLSEYDNVLKLILSSLSLTEKLADEIYHRAIEFGVNDLIIFLLKEFPLLSKNKEITEAAEQADFQWFA